MAWYLYVAYLFAGAFLANSVPHFVSGVMGRKFPSPFASPPGKGLSSPIVNALWGFGNFVAGYLLLCIGTFMPSLTLDSLAVLLGALAISLQLAWHFDRVQASRD